MAGSTGVYRRISQRPFQRAIRSKYIVGAEGHKASNLIGAVEKLRKQLGRTEPRQFDYRYQLFRNQPKRIVRPKRRREPGYIAAIRNLRSQLGREEIQTDVRWQIQKALSRRRAIGGTSPASDIGWLASFIIKRAYGTHIRR